MHPCDVASDRRSSTVDGTTGRTKFAAPTAIADALLPLVEHLDSTSGGAEPEVVGTGFPDLDDVLDGGLRPGTLTIVAGRPGAGCSTLVYNIASHIAIFGRTPCCLYTFDTGEREVFRRIVGSTTLIPRDNLRAAAMSPDERQRLVAQTPRMSTSPLFIDAGPAPHLDALCAAIVALRKREDVAVVVIDPLPLIVARSFADNREREVAEIARGLKALAVEHGLCLVATAVTGRRPGRGHVPPGLDDLRETDTLAQVADVVILLHRPDADAASHSRIGETDLIVAKNRYGEPDTVTVGHRFDYARFGTIR